MSADDDVGALAARCRQRQLLADLAELELLDGDDDAVLVGERLGDRLDDGLPSVVGPDHEVSVAAVGGGRRRLGGGRSLGAGGFGAGGLGAGGLGAGRLGAGGLGAGWRLGGRSDRAGGAEQHHGGEN